MTARKMNRGPRAPGRPGADAGCPRPGFPGGGFFGPDRAWDSIRFRGNLGSWRTRCLVSRGPLELVFSGDAPGTVFQVHRVRRAFPGAREPGAASRVRRGRRRAPPGSRPGDDQAAGSWFSKGLYPPHARPQAPGLFFPGRLVLASWMPIVCDVERPPGRPS